MLYLGGYCFEFEANLRLERRASIDGETCFDSDRGDGDIHRWGNYQRNQNITGSAVCLIQIVETVTYIDG